MAILTGCLRETSQPLARSRLLPIHVHVAVAGGDLDAAADALTELEEIAATYDTPMLHASALAACGRLALASQDVTTARSALEQARERWQALDVPYEIATTLTLLGQALRVDGDEAGATASFETAVELFDQIGAHLDARLVLDDASPGLPAGLTEREVEVLRLVAGGLSNNEIAAELYLEREDGLAPPVEHLHQDRGHLPGQRHRLRLRARARRATAVAPARGRLRRTEPTGRRRDRGPDAGPRPG